MEKVALTLGISTWQRPEWVDFPMSSGLWVLPLRRGSSEGLTATLTRCAILVYYPI